jgi:hypothetical protein
MHEEMAGFYEVRVQGGGMNHRLFCFLDRNAAGRQAARVPRLLSRATQRDRD